MVVAGPREGLRVPRAGDINIQERDGVNARAASGSKRDRQG